MLDTICAIATSLGIGAISIIRVSGTDAIKIVNEVFNGKNLLKVPTHTIHYGYIIYKNEIIDEVLVSVMKAPKTFTCEDVVEINCHGGITTTNKILEILLLIGCRLAEPGEFTKRAFLNGRIDLMKAEAVMDIINVKTDKARKIAINQLQGKSSNLIKNLRKELVSIISNIEVNIDYPEYQDIYEVTICDIKSKTGDIKKKLEKIITEYNNGRILKEGIKVAIVGQPNVGKSSMLNKLLDCEKAIVTDIPGTTRDIVEGSFTIDGILLNIVDTAGIRKTNDIVEQIGVQKSLEIIDKVDLVLVILNNNKVIDDIDKEILNKTNKVTSIVVINKKDLPSKINYDLIGNREIVYTDTLSDNGIVDLKNRIRQLFNFEKLDSSDYNYVSNVRQIAKVEECLSIINDVINSIGDNAMLDMIEIDLKNIWNILGEIIGDSYSEELLDELFSKFCVGK